MAYKPVDTAIVCIVGPLIDDTDFKSLETGIAYDATGMSLDWIQEEADGTTTKTDLTLTTGGDNDWTHLGNGYYAVEISAAQNNIEGMGWVGGLCTGVLPFESPHYNIVPIKVYNSLVIGSDNLEVDAVEISGDATSANNAELMFDGTGYAGGTTKLQVDAAAATVIVEGTTDLIEALRLILAAVAGKASGGGTSTVTFRDTGDTKDRIILTVDSSGNRSAVTLDAS